MKKILSLLVAIALTVTFTAVFASAEYDENAGDNRPVIIYESENTPVIDGVVNDGEYHLVSSWPEDQIIQSRGDYVGNLKSYLYMSYDDENLYYAVKTECDEPHVAYIEGDHYIFNAHYLMTMIIPDDPTNGVYPGEEAGWGDLYNGGFCYEWSLIANSKTNKKEASDHFLDMSQKMTYEAKSADGWDTYEIAIPWTAMTTGKQTTALTATEGTVFGFDYTLGFTDIGDGYDGTDGIYKGNYLYFAGTYATTGGKSLKDAAIVELGGAYELPAEESSTPVTSSEKPTTETSDNGVIALVVIASLAAAGAVIVKKVR